MKDELKIYILYGVMSLILESIIIPLLWLEITGSNSECRGYLFGFVICGVCALLVIILTTLPKNDYLDKWF